MKSAQENGPKAEKDQKERAPGLYNKQKQPKEETQKSGIKLTALRFQAGGETSEISGLPSGAAGYSSE